MQEFLYKQEWINTNILVDGWLLDPPVKHPRNEHSRVLNELKMHAIYVYTVLLCNLIYVYLLINY